MTRKKKKAELSDAAKLQKKFKECKLPFYWDNPMNDEFIDRPRSHANVIKMPKPRSNES
jgi:hypothetical protein